MFVPATNFEPSEYELPAHYCPRQYAAVWKNLPHQWQHRLEEVAAQLSTNHPPLVFFRADDIGAGGRAFNALCRLFRDYQVPLAMSVVPAWLSNVRIKELFRYAPLDEKLWGWHQHGWRHVNWQRGGKKSEFGKHRSFEKQWKDIWHGQQKMREIFGAHLLPVFTPPWNRLSLSTLKILHELDFSAVSLTDPLPRGNRQNAQLKNLRILLDLHTRKAKDGHADYESLLEELRFSLGRKEPLGIMIHHHRMTLSAFEFLKKLIELLKFELNANFLTFHQLLDMER